MAIIKCPECGHQVSDHATSCPSCGIGIAGHVKKCPHCGAVVFADKDICPDCHCNLNAPLARPKAEREAVEEVGKPVPTPQPQAAPDKGGDSADGVNTPPRQPKKKSYIVIVITVVILLIAGFVVYYIYDNSQRRSEQEAYASAMRSGEAGVMQNYLDIYKDAPTAHRDSVQFLLDQLMQADREWTDVLVSGSKVAIERYLQLHPGSPHEMEGRLRIDSLDWVAAEQAGTVEAYKRYIDSHADGAYIDEAHKRFDELDAQQVSEADCEAMARIFGDFFRAFGANDDDALTATLANVMDEFLTKPSAVKSDVVAYMHKQHAAEGATLEYTPNNDYKIEKQPAADESGMEFSVKFSVDEKRTNADGTTALSSLEVTANVDSNGKICLLKMKRLAQ